ncbi:unnamed protein product [Didymodactylos carnosus]|uniref:Uncharacterized protein n=1 Tax=Didymodactylos carnosus TaxID=1234261 RepID=A0A813R323_9BILA|nr:unnamed protein product [Didymodactylos carnosus]CAF0816533.1 unnamed protein product [Didymodactylos carnosus]CAF3560101.1 unnamed protein product [Didymodactylos carnosus]CAF3600615.1 unnamed protein product [Didymodactylos carnosus]
MFSSQLSDSSFTSSDSYVSERQRAPLGRLSVIDLYNQETQSNGFDPYEQQYRFTPIPTIPRPFVRVPTVRRLWQPYSRISQPVLPDRSIIEHVSNPRLDQQLNPPSERNHTPSVISQPIVSNYIQNDPRRLLPRVAPPSIPDLQFYELNNSVSSTRTVIPPVETIETPQTDRQLYQIVPVTRTIQRPPVPVRQKSIPSKKPVVNNKKPKHKANIFTRLCAGGIGTVVSLLYLCFVLVVPVAKLTLGIIFIDQCPIEPNIPLYLIIAGSCGITVVLLLIISSGCALLRSFNNKEKTGHFLVMFIISAATGIRRAVAVFLFVWFFVGNIWIFGVRSRGVQTERADSTPTYCHPVLYTFSFWLLIATYISAILTCCIKCCTNFFCCGVCDIWKKAFSS